MACDSYGNRESATAAGGRKIKDTAEKYLLFWRVGRVVECGGLENRCRRKATGGSNPPLSAMLSTERSEEAPYRGLPTRKRGGALLK